MIPGLCPKCNYKVIDAYEASKSFTFIGIDLEHLENQTRNIYNYKCNNCTGIFVLMGDYHN